VEIEVGPDRQLLHGHCNCVSGISGNCKHTCALVTYVNSERTDGCTDNTQQWQKPSQHKQSLYPKGETIEALFGLDPLPPLSFKKNDEKLNKFAELLAQNNETKGMFYKAVTTKPVPEIPAQSVIDIDLQKLQTVFQENRITFNSMEQSNSGTKITFRKFECTLTEKTKLFFKENVEKSLTECCHTFTSTLGQSLNPNWFLQRKMRISASRCQFHSTFNANDSKKLDSFSNNMFCYDVKGLAFMDRNTLNVDCNIIRRAHKILRGKKIETRLKYFFKSPPSTKGMMYGLNMEKTALEHYSKMTGNKVIESGLILKPNQTWLCSSPDGLIKEQKVCLEIKCPSSCENKEISVDYVRDNKLVKTHPYFTQVQLQMYTSNSDVCHFFVFSQKDFILINVLRDDEFL
jgi:hypothetical protein